MILVWIFQLFPQKQEALALFVSMLRTQ